MSPMPVDGRPDQAPTAAAPAPAPLPPVPSPDVTQLAAGATTKVRAGPAAAVRIAVEVLPGSEEIAAQHGKRSFHRSGQPPVSGDHRGGTLRSRYRRSQPGRRTSTQPDVRPARYARLMLPDRAPAAQYPSTGPLRTKRGIGSASMNHDCTHQHAPPLTEKAALFRRAHRQSLRTRIACSGRVRYRRGTVRPHRPSA